MRMKRKNKLQILILATLPMFNYVAAMPLSESAPVARPSHNPYPMMKPPLIKARHTFNPVPFESVPLVQNNKKKNLAVDSNKVVLNFENADIQTVIKAISQLSGKNFVIDPRVKGTVNIVSDKPISKADSYKVLESALRMQGFASVEADGVIKILPEADARTYGMKMEKSLGGNISQKHQLGDQVITKIFVIQHGSATALVNALRPLVAPNNSIGVYPNSNAIIITDYSSNIKRIAAIISQLTTTDEGLATSPVIVNLHNAIAADVAEILNSYMSGGGSTSGGRGGGGRSGGGGNSDTPSATITVNVNDNSLIIYSPMN